MREPRSGNPSGRAGRFERQAVRPLAPKKYARRVAADRSGSWSRPENPSAGGRSALPLSYAPNGRRDSNPRHRRNPRLRNRPTSTVKEHDNCRGIVWLRGQGSNLDLLFQRQAWFRFHHLAWVWLAVRRARGSGRRDSNSQPPASEAGALPLRHVQACVSTDGGIRTRTDGGLSAGPLPLGYVSMCVCSVDRAGLEPATFSLQGSCASSCATGPDLCAARWSRGRESNPRAGRMRPRWTQCPRSVTGRTRTDFLRGHVPASRPLRTSVTVDEEGVEPPASCM